MLERTCVSTDWSTRCDRRRHEGRNEAGDGNKVTMANGVKTEAVGFQGKKRIREVKEG